MTQSINISDQVIISIRRIIRAIDLQSRKLVESHGLTGPQALILKTLQNGEQTAGQLANNVSLSQGTVTDILNRLEKRKLIQRVRDTEDRRRVVVTATDAGLQLVKTSPQLLQDRFIHRFESLADWEQSQLLASLQRVASLMDAGEIDAAPVLSSGAITASAKAVEDVIEPGNDLPDLDQ